MSDKRPAELIQQQKEAFDINNGLIVDALNKLEQDTDLKLKPTVATLCELTGLSKNTIRGRETAMERLQMIKVSRRVKRTNAPAIPEEPSRTLSVEDGLRAQVDEVVKQNTLLYDEILFLREQLSSKEREIQALKNTKLKLLRNNDKGF